jgi:NAD(P)-dependent dehydrogenase (short-subunit alcohol dehydrogenase family)
MVDGTGRPVALITGGSRGVGAATALAFADNGYDVIFTYRNKTTRADQIVAEVTRRGARALAVQCDITRESEVTSLIATTREWAGRLDALVLNASGGLERDLLAANPRYAWLINRDAQVMVLDHALTLMASSGDVIFVTSHWAHLYGRVEQIAAYEPIAETKHAGEQALRARQDDLTRRGIRLIVVTGDLIDGTTTPKLLERAAPGLAAGRRAALGVLPTAEDMGRAIVSAATDRTVPTGHTIVVGGDLDSLLD